jgi:D-alanyl-D-alanine dipeptidase
MRNFIIIVVLFLFSCKTENKKTVIPFETEQLLLVITDSLQSPSGVIYAFEKQANENDFTQVFDGFNVRLGKNGLAWGRGLHPVNEDMKVFKKEGDGKSPAGVFLLESVFGFKTAAEMKYLKMPYIQITEMLECIDDKTSKYYNKIIESNKADTLDWNSSEKMFKYGKWYEQGVVVAHNKSKIEPGCGSCIFIHNMVEPDETTAGCTELMPEDIKLIIDWLDIAKTPVLVQLSAGDYKVYKNKWTLPSIKK